MTLGFKTHFNEKPSFFMEKIWKSIKDHEITKELADATHIHNFNWTVWGNIPPKIHSIRKDNSNQWKVGNKIHFVYHNRTPNRFQFAPVLKVLKIEEIHIKITSKNCENKVTGALIYIGDHYLGGYNYHGELPSQKCVKELAINDGFETIEEFFSFFNDDFIGKIIHWTDFKYEDI